MPSGNNTRCGRYPAGLPAGCSASRWYSGPSLPKRYAPGRRGCAGLLSLRRSSRRYGARLSRLSAEKETLHEGQGQVQVPALWFHLTRRAGDMCRNVHTRVLSPGLHQLHDPTPGNRYPASFWRAGDRIDRACDPDRFSTGVSLNDLSAGHDPGPGTVIVAHPGILLQKGVLFL